jgi:hypothetical protein
LRTVISLRVRAPVLSVQMNVVKPSVSTDSTLRTSPPVCHSLRRAGE